MAEGTGAAGAMGGVAAAAGAAAATGTPGTTPNLTVVQGGAGGAPGGGGTGQPTAAAMDAAKPTAGQSPGETKTWDVKVDGKIVRMTEAEMIQNASLGKAAFKRMEEANGLKSRVDSFWEAFQKDPMAALDNPAITLTPAQKRAAVEKYYKEKYIDTDAMSPEQRENAELKAKLAERDKRDADAEEAKASHARQVLEGQWREHFSKVIIEALDKGGLPKTPKTIGRMAFYLAENARNKIDQTIDQVAKRVEADYAEEFQGLASDEAPVEALIRILGPNAVKKLQKYALEEHKKKLAAGIAPPEPAAARAKPEKKEESPREGWKKTTNYWTRHDK